MRLKHLGEPVLLNLTGDKYDMTVYGRRGRTNTLGSFREDADGWPVLNGRRLTPSEVKRGWVYCDS